MYLDAFGTFEVHIIHVLKLVHAVNLENTPDKQDMVYKIQITASMSDAQMQNTLLLERALVHVATNHNYKPNLFEALVACKHFQLDPFFFPQL